MSRLLALSLALLLAACSASSKSSKKPSSADSEFKEWGSDSSESSSSSKDDEAEPEFKDPKREKLSDGPNCVDEKGDVKECLHDSDCCRNFYCGIDPAGSSRIKVCLYGG